MRLPPAGSYGVGMFFLSLARGGGQPVARQVIAEGVRHAGLALLDGRRAR